MNEQIFTPQFRAAFQSLVNYEVYEDAYDNDSNYYNLKFYLAKVPETFRAFLVTKI